MQIYCLLDTGTCSQTVFIFSKAEFHGQREYFSFYDDWTLLIDMDIAESLNLIKKTEFMKI